jgi:hypothetical protein
MAAATAYRPTHRLKSIAPRPAVIAPNRRRHFAIAGGRT